MRHQSGFYDFAAELVLTKHKLFSTIAFIGLMAWSMCTCAAPKTQSPTLPLEVSATPTAVPTVAQEDEQYQEGKMRDMEKSSPVVNTLVNVGDYHLHFRVYPGSEPAVLLESGGGADASYWNDLAPLLARETGATIITYDRAGYGESDLPDTPYDIHQEVAGLWRGLEQLGHTNSLILLGHSWGGMLILVTACEHPDAVRGLVFLDAMNVEFIDAIGGAEGLTSHPLSQHPFDPSQKERLTKPQLAALRVEAGMPGVVTYMHTLSIPQHIPVRVITAGKPWWPKPEENRAWRESHEHLAASVKDGKLLVAERSAHLVPDEQPEIIVAAVAELVRVARAWKLHEPSSPSWPCASSAAPFFSV
jgi:pimeloyl-ACP methyl ester carboxylesterase